MIWQWWLMGIVLPGSDYMYSVLIYLTVPFSLLYRRIQVRFNKVPLVFLGIGVLVLNYLFSPWIGIYVWTILFLVRVMYSPIKEAAITHLINTHTESKIRTTTISTYELVRKMPYLLVAGMIADWVDNFGVKWVAFGFATLLGLLTLPQAVYYMVRREKYAE